MPFCRKCGFEYFTEDSYCNKCGIKLISTSNSEKEISNSNTKEIASSNSEEIYIDKATLNGPSIITQGTEVNNTVVWMLALMPLISIIIEIILDVVFELQFLELWWITLLLNIVFFIIDYKIIVKVKPELFLLRTWIMIIPVYLFKRAKAFNHNYSYFVIWIILYTILIIFTFLNNLLI